MTAALLEARGISKRYAHVTALSDVEITINRGEVLALVGDNGAGKSTLIKVLSGAVRPDAGEIHIDGERVVFDTPADAHRSGIETLYQDLALAPDLDVAANLFLGRELKAAGVLGLVGVLNRGTMRRQARSVLRQFGSQVSAAHVPVKSLSGGQQQIVAAARAAMWARRLIFMDEPTAALGVKQTGQIRDLVKRLTQAQGMAVVLVSHNLPQVLELADRIEVLHLGRTVGGFLRSEATTEGLVAAMTGASANSRSGSNEGIAP